MTLRQSPTSTVIVYEKRPRWTPELQRQFVDEAIAVRGCRSWRDLSALSQAEPDGVVIIDLEVGSAACLQWLTQELRRARRTPIIILGSPTAAELEWPLREAGVTEFLAEPPPGDRLALLCRRMLPEVSRTQPTFGPEDQLFESSKLFSGGVPTKPAPAESLRPDS